jgi:hypothetical protein
MRLTLSNATLRATRKAMLRLSLALRPITAKLGELDALPGQGLATWRFRAGEQAIRALLAAQRFPAARPLLLIVTSGLALRIYRLDLLGYNSDEAVYAGQAAAIANDPALTQFFPIFRAHPLLFQFLLALLFQNGVVPVLARAAAAAVGVVNVLLVYRLGNELYGRRAGLLSALFLSLMPYHTVVSRQVLLDGPMTLCATLTLWLMTRFASTQRPAWLYAAGAGMGLTFLAKETGIVLLGAIYAFLALSPEIRVRVRELVLSLVAMTAVIAPFPLSLALAGGSSAGRHYLVWQLFRRPNHEWDFYLINVPSTIGPLLLLAAGLGLWLLRREHSWKEKLLLLWIAEPTLFFQFWPVKGYQYLLPAAPPIAILAGRSLARWISAPDRRLLRWNLRSASMGAWATTIIAGTLVISSWRALFPYAASGRFLAGSGGVPGGREAGRWIEQNTPQGSTLMTIGPSMANILQFYGHRRAYGISVSPNPLHRNPSYDPLPNPDFSIRSGAIQYLVWDAFSAGRSPFFSEKLLGYVRKYHGRAIHSEFITAQDAEGGTTLKPVIVVYAVRP